MSDQFDASPIASALQNSREICVALTSQPDLDVVASGLALYLALSQAGKQVAITCDSPMVVEHSRLVGLDKVKSSIGNQNLIVSFAYQKDSIEKVSYHVAGDRFNLVIQPKKGSRPLDPKAVEYSYNGLSTDLIFIVGAASFTDLGKIYQKHETAFSDAYTISLNQTLSTHFAKTSITDPHASSVSEITVWLLEQLGYLPQGDVATNLLAGIDDRTQRFSKVGTPASAFSIAGRLMQNGAVRQTIINRPKSSNLPMPKNSAIPTQKFQNLPRQQAGLLRPMPASFSAAMPPETLAKTDAADLPPTNPPAGGPATPPKEWLEPKIFQGSTKV